MYAATLLGIAIAAAILTFIMYYFSLFSYPILSALYAFLIFQEADGDFSAGCGNDNLG